MSIPFHYYFSKLLEPKLAEGERRLVEKVRVVLGK
jgi:hypothetical protein